MSAPSALVTVSTVRSPEGHPTATRTPLGGAGHVRTDERRRVALYSHDTVGLGHLRRNLALASAIHDGPVPVDVLLLSGSRESTAFAAPAGIDLVTLPALAKRDGHYSPRTLKAPLRDIVDLRSSIITAALIAFEPDVLIVDKVARGACGELEDVLTWFRAAGGTRCVLGLRDVLDDAATTIAEWSAARTTEAITELYDEVWVYGDAAVFDPVVEYDLPASVVERTTFTGYLGHGRPRQGPDVIDDAVDPPYALCLVGGGQDGLGLAEAFAAAPFPEGTQGVVVAGPYMDMDGRARLDARAAARTDLAVLDFVVDCERLIAGATSVISMGGYNTVCEVLAAGKRPLVVPRVRPRAEQLLRAERLAEHDLVDVLRMDGLTPARIGAWLASGRGEERPDNRSVDLDGLARIPVLVERLLTGRTTRPEPARAAV